MKYLWLLLSLCFMGCSPAKKQGEDVIRMTILRGPTAIAFAEWITSAPTLGTKKVVVDIVDSPQQVQAALIRKSTDIAALPMISAANLSAKGVAYSLAGCPVWGTLYIVGREGAGQLHIFGAGTTPDILARYYLEEEKNDYTLNYTLGTATEVAQGLLSGKVEAAVLGEPFVSLVLNRDTTIRILADLNSPGGSLPGFPQTAILIHPDLEAERSQIDEIIRSSCQFATGYPERVIDILQKQDLFPAGVLTPATIGRCKIAYYPASEIAEEVESFLRLIYDYEPQSVGGKLPDDSFHRL